MKKIELSRRHVLQGAAVASAIAALGIRPEQVVAAEGNTIKIRGEKDIQVLDPAHQIGGGETPVIYACLPRLAVAVREADGNWGWQPSEYVEKITQDDPTHISFTLKKGQMWSDNLGELTTDDVKYSLERMLKSDWAGRWPTLDHVEIKDKYSGVVVFKAPFDGAFLIGFTTTSGSILPKAAMQKLEGEKFTTKLPGQLGPYTMVSWTPKQNVILKANPDWHGTKPAFDEVILVDIEDLNAAELAFEAHEISLTRVTVDTAARYKKTPVANTKLVNLPGPNYTWLGMNTENPKLKDIRVRQAIQRSVDVDAVLQGAYAGLAPRSYGVIPIGVLGHRDSSKYSYNIDEAKKLLADAGVSGLSLDLYVENDVPELVAAAQIIQANLADVGIQVKVLPTDSGTFWNLGLESKGTAWKTLDMWIMRFTCSPDPADAIQWYKKDQIGIWNWERWSNPEFDDLWAKGLVETDHEKRAAIYVRMQEIMEDTGAYTWLTFDPCYYISAQSLNPAFDPATELRVEMFGKA